MLNILLVILLLICAYTDFKHRKIYNMVLLPALLLGFALNLWENGLIGYKESLLGMLLGAALLLIPYFMGGMGAGDVKLLAAIGAIGGIGFVFQVFVFTALVGGLMALIAALKSGTLMLTLIRAANPRVTGNLNEQVGSATIPYGLAIAAGGLMALLLG